MNYYIILNISNLNNIKSLMHLALVKIVRWVLTTNNFITRAWNVHLKFNYFEFWKVILICWKIEFYKYHMALIKRFGLKGDFEIVFLKKNCDGINWWGLRSKWGQYFLLKIIVSENDEGRNYY